MNELKINDKVKHINHLDWGVGIIVWHSAEPSTEKVCVKFNKIARFPATMCSIKNLIKQD